MATPLDLVVRFSSSEPDQTIYIANAQQTSGLSLKQQIRTNLSAPANTSRLRLIHAGKVLTDGDALSKSLGTVHPPPLQDITSKSEKARGKQPVRDGKAVARVYIHCSIGDVLSAAELAEEGAKTEAADAALLSTDVKAMRQTGSTGQETPTTTTTPAPQGFDRLLTAGFTAAEVASLRSQFLAIQAHTHTPDTMPTGPALLALEERWLEQPNANTGNGGADDLTGDDGLDDMLIGSIVGFFWPVGVMCWLMREEGVWSRRRQLMVMLGFAINLMFGFFRLMT